MKNITEERNLQATNFELQNKTIFFKGYIEFY